MADFEPDRGPPTSVADALSAPAPPFISAQSKIVTLNIATHSIDKCQEATYPGTETYTTSYDKPVLLRTKLDHDHNDRRNNGIRYTTKQVPIDKICNQNLKAIIKETDYPSMTQHQQSGILTKGKFKASTTHSTIPQVANIHQKPQWTPSNTIPNTQHHIYAQIQHAT